MEEAQQEEFQEFEGEVVFEECEEWEVYGGKRVDNEGRIVSKYQRGQLPSDYYNLYCIDDSQRGGTSFRPWLGAVKDPSNPPAFNPAQPDECLVLQHVYGFRAFDTRQNVWYTASAQEIVYMTAALGIVLNTETNVQKFFGGGEVGTVSGHDDDVTAIAIHPDRTLVVTGQIGKNPRICVWDSRDCTLKSAFSQGVDTKSVKSISFSASGKYVYTIADNDKHTVSAFDWESGKLIASQNTGADFVIGLKGSPKDDTIFAIAGKNGIKIGQLTKEGIKISKGIFGKNPMADMYSLEWTSDGRLFTGSLKGNLYVWTGNTCTKTIPCHNGSLSAMSYRGGRLVTGGKDGYVHIFDKDLRIKKKINVGSMPRAIDQDSEGDIVVGLKNGTILEIKDESKLKLHMKGHSEGEAWGLAICPKTGYVITSCDDNRILVWDPTKKTCVNIGTVNETAGPKPKGGASTTSTFPPNQCARALDVNAVNGHVCIGINNGEFSIRASSTDLNKVIAQRKDAKEWIEVVKYSPDGEKLAVGSHDNAVYIYTVGDGYKPFKKLNKHTSFITALDWSEDSNFLHTQCGAYDLLYWDVNSGTQITDADALKDEEWAEWTLKLGWPVQGIQPIGVDGTHINGVCRSNNKKLLATGDDWRLVNLFRNPCLAKGKPKSYIAHAEHVTRAVFSKKDDLLFTIGGADRTLMQWKVMFS